MIEIIINNNKFFVEKGTNLLEFAKSQNIYIPSLCYLKDKPPPSSPCGLCVVEIEGEGLVRACEYTIKKKIKVNTHSPQVKEIRKKILENLIANHYGDCRAPCQIPCPGGLNIQGFIGFIATGDFKSALALIKEKLPFPAIVGRVCPRFCEPICRRNFLDSPVAINNLKRFVGDYGLKYGEIPPEIKPLNGKKVAIIGAGPAGLSCAYFLRLEGFEVTVYDKESEPGGLLRYGIPSFKLPKDVVKKEIENVLKLGIKFIGNKTWGKDFTLKDLFEEGFSAIFISTGAKKEKFFGFKGEELAESGYQFLYKFNKNEISKEKYQNKKVAVLGCTYTGLELARILVRLNCNVILYHPRSRMELPLLHREINYAEKEGVKFSFVTAPLNLKKNENKFELILARTVLTETREIKILEDTIFREEVDIVFRAWGEEPDLSFINFGEIESQIKIDENNKIEVSSNLETNIPGVFVGGDLLYGTKTVIQAVASGRKAAFAIKSYLEKNTKEKSQGVSSVRFEFNRGRRIEEFDTNFLDLFAPEERSRLKERDPKERIKDFDEVLIGLTEEEAIKEANRCLKCGCLGIHKCEFREILIKENIPVTKARKKMKYPIQKDHPLIEVDLNKCVACEKCVRSCPHSAIHFRVFNKGTPLEFITFKFTENCTNCGICVDVCPTGALIKKQLVVPYSRKTVKEVKSVCPFCGVGCNLTIWVKNRTILEVTGRDEPPNYGSTCVKGRFGWDFYKHKDRLTKPLIRESIKDEFREVDWEEALEFVAKNLLRIKEKYGGNALGFLASSRASNEENYLFQKIARAIFKTNNIDCSARVCHASSVAGLSATVGSGAPCSPFDDILQTELLFLIGTNSAEAHPVIFQKILKALNKGTKCIVIDPKETPLAEKADLYIPLKPGTDTAFLNGIAYVILRDKLYNEEFIKKYVENFNEYRAYILSEWDLGRVEKTTELKAFLIEQTAYFYATSKSALILWGLGLSQQRDGSYATAAAANLATLCGFWGKPGCGAMPLRGQNNVQGACDLGCLPYVLPGYQKYTDEKTRTEFEKIWGTKIPTEEGLTLHKMLKRAKEEGIKALYLMGYDIAMSQNNLKEVWKGLENLEFLVVQDIFMPLSGKWAHAILPAACVFEKEGTFTNGERRVQLFEKAVDPPGKALPDWLILTKLAQKLGYNWNYTSPADICEEIGRVWEDWKGIKFYRLKEKGIQWPCPDEKHPGTPHLYYENFPKGKIHLAIPKYIPPSEIPGKEYPFSLITAKTLYHCNCGHMTRRSPVLMKFLNYPLLEINPEDAKKIGICEGVFVKVKSKRGEAIYKIKFNKNIPKGYLCTDFAFTQALTNLLTSEGVDEIMDTPEYKITAVKIEPITLFEEERKKC